ncbi:2-C-methyl-D-erythritol 2,4-cyclodiphosphate synthase [Candidatus Venteria ishoeyi]|uniref:2-C-methyl-D-erythritol 2,4-cyclodiphosphate synthase n=1 Tax=Candidatus Venteria ishoeyi TaxID=1899563 RepID=UPI0025A5CD17|nr:2-C-methyl-D-erythritol 2,4-cyclodiphosphate synthase [Candidatus Venteria ishoeyi]MDM8545662.1 2-C-methyl-D-erythritol 2,4-cyclodiphosphate synthase [Candidatus Venteria ishoeyi]
MITGIGQDSHRFDLENSKKILKLGGVAFLGEPPLKGNSDADVVLHAITNAVSGITGVNILGVVSDKLCLEQGITDSRVYLQEALKYLQNKQLTHVSISIECKFPKISPKIPEMKQSIADLLDLSSNQIGITATTGEGLTAFGRGEGIQALVIVSAS